MMLTRITLCTGIRYTHLYKCAIPVVEDGARSSGHYKTALHELEELTNKFDPVEDSLV
jgi:hypothetical protein